MHLKLDGVGDLMTSHQRTAHVETHAGPSILGFGKRRVRITTAGTLLDDATTTAFITKEIGGAITAN
eukprot:9001673-Pyramimonas_sp.AAC.1